MLSRQIRRLIVTGIACTVVSWGVPSQAQELIIGESQTEEAEAESISTISKVVTTQDPEIPIDELKLLVKPLTQPELENEAAAWMVLLRQKVQEISDAEIVVKRENRSIAKQEEAVKALEEATQALKVAEESKAVATAGSPEYEEATRKIEEAQENLKKAQEAIEEAATTKAELQEDETLQSVIEEAKETSQLERAKQAIEQAKKDREQVDSWSYEYEEITLQIEDLEIAIETYEYAQEIQANTPPETWEYEDATQQLEAARNSLKQATEAILGVDTNSPTPTEQSSESFDQTADSLSNTTIEGNLEVKVASVVEETPSIENLEEKQDQLEKTTEQLQENAEAESELKNQLVSNIVELQAEQTAIIDRFEIVLDELEKKGGAVDSYQNYIQAVSTIEIDLQDTEGLGVRLMGWLKSEEGGLRWGINMSKFISIVIASIIVSQIIGLILNKILSKFSNTSDIFRQFVVMLVKRGGVVVGCMIGLTALEVSLGPILALVGGASFVIAFALQSNLANLASGLMLMVYKPFDTGDEVKIGDIWGYVDSITLANTKIQGWGKEEINIPNNTVWGNTIINLTSQDIRGGMIKVPVPFTQKITEVERILQEIGESHPLIIKAGTFPWEYAEYYVYLCFSFKTKTPDFWTVWSDLMHSIQERFEQEKIALAVPVQEIRVQSTSNGEFPQPSVGLSQKSLQDYPSTVHTS
ncbi:mechanosensitive ion channel family protein [Lyngbya aestuarii BL J]|uniref:Mechanosensitive ion channel family protein n=1 Tax=Lyngbya aestuarii BL J TaxID=1348334 RepID=U7QL96_9CYAN|nr:mechanosensitive ion channel family protein [Lyngbya aestuarii]ERT08042.1 mechanosensitive ion channel family protein [Lyngbya aestuarii BL J]